MYERMGWVAQKKKNGTCCVIFTNGKQVIFKQRRLDQNHLAWSPLEAHLDFFRAHGGVNGTWNVFVGELLHNKTTHIKNHIFLFDQIVKDGQHLVGVKLQDRLNLLLEFGGLEGDDSFLIIPEVSVVKCFTKGFEAMFSTLKKEDEGLVVKNPQATLNACFKEGTNGAWQVKSRIPHKNYGY